MNLSRHSALRQEGSFLSWCFFASGALISWTAGWDTIAPWLPFFLSIGLIGLPHGAADWLLLRPATKQDAIRKFLLYSLAGLLTAALAWLFPIVAIVGFFILTIIHFGTGDERDLRTREPASAAPTMVRFSGVFRMAIFFGLICLCDGDSVVALFGRVGSLLGSNEGTVFTNASLQAASLFVLSGGVLCWAASLFLQGRSRFRDGSFALHRKRRLEIEIFEGALLFLAAGLLNAVFAVGLYFLCWHALRHSVLLARGTASPFQQGRSSLLRQLAILQLRSWPLFLPVIPLMFGLVWANGSFVSPTDWVAALLVVCIIFTLPHHWIVERNLNSEVILERSPAKHSASAGAELPFTRTRA